MEAMQNVRFIPLRKNRGIAAALNIGAERARADGFRYLLTMDQDSLPDPSMVDAMRRYIIDGEEFGILSPVYQLSTGGPLNVHTGIRSIESAMTSGNILDLQAFAAAGTFCEKLFIDYVDHEYCLRLPSSGYRILQVQDAVLHHSWGALQQRSVFGFRFSTSNYAPFRYYYLVRNCIYVVSRYWRRFPGFCAVQSLLVVKMVLKSLLLEPHRFRRAVFVVRGVVDFARNRFGPLT